MDTTTVTEAPPKTQQLILIPWLRRLAANYFVRRIARALITAFVVTTLTFFLIRLLPGNPIDVFVNQLVLEQGIPYHEAYDRAAALFAIDLGQPVLLQYFDYLSGLIRGDLGKSILSPGTTVSSIIVRFLPWTIFSVGVSLMISFVIGILLGLIMAYRREGVLDQVLTVFASITTSVPNYLIAILLVVWLGVQWGIVPIAQMRGSLSSGVKAELSLAFIKDVFFHASLPIFTYVLTTLGGWMLTMKSSTISVLEEDYVTVARAKGLKGSRIVSAYVGRNAALPLFTQLTIAIGFVVGGAALIETVFRYEGIGIRLIQAIQRRDYTVMQAIFVIITLSVIFANLFADILYSWIDPRIKLGRDR
ncbi:MAG TPA: ABC transporter permease [Anaerolineae bacterium]